MIGPAHQQWRVLIGPAGQAGSRQSAANTGWQWGIGQSGPEESLAGEACCVLQGKVLQAKIGEGQTPVMHTLRPQEMLKQTQMFETLN